MVKAVKKKFNLFHAHHIKPHHQNKKLTKAVDSGVSAMGLFSSFMALPQVIKVYSTQNVGSLTAITWLTAFLASLAWLFYGIFYKSKPILASSSVSLLVNFMMVISFLIF